MLYGLRLCVCVCVGSGINMFVRFVCELWCNVVWCVCVCFACSCALYVLRAMRVMYGVMLYGVSLAFLNTKSIDCVLVLICLCGAFMLHSALLHGLCFCGVACVRVGVNVFVCFIVMYRVTLCGVYLLCYVCLCVFVFVVLCSWMLCVSCCATTYVVVYVYLSCVCFCLMCLCGLFVACDLLCDMFWSVLLCCFVFCVFVCCLMFKCV